MTNIKFQIVNFGISMVGALENCIDAMENAKEFSEQIEGDLFFGGINQEIKEQIVLEIIAKLHELIPSVVIYTYDK